MEPCTFGTSVDGGATGAAAVLRRLFWVSGWTAPIAGQPGSNEGSNFASLAEVIPILWEEPRNKKLSKENKFKNCGGKCIQIVCEVLWKFLKS